MGLMKARQEEAGAPPCEEAPSREALLAALAEGDAARRREAARLLGGLPESEGLLAVALRREREQSVQEAIVAALCEAATPDATAILLSQLRAGDAWLRNAVSAALQEIGPPAAAAVATRLEEADPHTRIATVVVLAGMRCQEAAGWLTDHLDRETEVNVCAAVVEALEQIGDATAVPALARLVERMADEPFLAFAADAVRRRLAGDPPR